MKIKIHPNSLIARIAAYKLKEKSVAITIGKHIFLYGVSKEHFLADKVWVCHELTHVTQYLQHGFFHFIFLYLRENIRSGYFNNRFEKDARNRENDFSLLDTFQLV